MQASWSRPRASALQIPAPQPQCEAISPCPEPSAAKLPVQKDLMKKVAEMIEATHQKLEVLGLEFREFRAANNSAPKSRMPKSLKTPSCPSWQPQHVACCSGPWHISCSSSGSFGAAGGPWGGGWGLSLVPFPHPET